MKYFNPGCSFNYVKPVFETKDSEDGREFPSCRDTRLSYARMTISFIFNPASVISSLSIVGARYSPRSMILSVLRRSRYQNSRSRTCLLCADSIDRSTIWIAVVNMESRKIEGGGGLNLTKGSSMNLSRSITFANSLEENSLKLDASDTRDREIGPAKV